MTLSRERQMNRKIHVWFEKGLWNPGFKITLKLRKKRRIRIGLGLIYISRAGGRGANPPLSPSIPFLMCTSILYLFTKLIEVYNYLLRKREFFLIHEGHFLLRYYRHFCDAYLHSKN